MAKKSPGNVMAISRSVDAERNAETFDLEFRDNGSLS